MGQKCFKSRILAVWHFFFIGTSFVQSAAILTLTVHVEPKPHAMLDENTKG